MFVMVPIFCQNLKKKVNRQTSMHLRKNISKREISLQQKNRYNFQINLILLIDITGKKIVFVHILLHYFYFFNNST